jgi:hypothetical protein
VPESSDSPPPAKRAMPASPSATPSMRQRAAAGATNETSRLGNGAVGTSWPTSAKKSPARVAPCGDPVGAADGRRLMDLDVQPVYPNVYQRTWTGHHKPLRRWGCRRRYPDGPARSPS